MGGAQRHSKNKKKMVSNGYSYDTENEAAHASDTLARKLIQNGEQGHQLNFPDDNTEVYKRGNSSVYIGVTYNKKLAKWGAQRYSKIEKKLIFNGYSYGTEEESAHASDTLARKFIGNGEQGHKLNFPDDNTELHKRKNSSHYIGVTYYKTNKKWRVQRHSKLNEKIVIHNGYYDTEEEAAHGSDILARRLMKNGEQGHKLNFPDDETKKENKRKRSKNSEILQEN